MTDLLAPLLLVLDDEVEAFWCFIEVMKKSTIYTIGNKQVSVRHQLVCHHKFACALCVYE